MPVLLVYGVPEDMEDEKLKKCWEDLRDSVALIDELGITKDQVSVFFPTDHLKEGLGEEIIIFVKGLISLFERPGKTEEVRQRLAENVGAIAQLHFPEAELVECFIEPFDPKLGFCHS